jgi:TPR repeat protein
MPVNYAEAAKWYRRAAEQGYAEAQHKLGTHYAEGWRVPRNYVLAYMWLSLAGAEGGAYADRATVVKGMPETQIESAKQLLWEWKRTSR